MTEEPKAPSFSEVADEVSAWLVGGGILSMALFPFALPIIALTVVAVIPLVLAGLALGLIVALVSTPILLVRRLLSSVGDSRRGPARIGSATAAS
jgi:hypothetical protein